MAVEAWLPRAAAAHPRRTALSTPQGSWSYAQLLAAARAGAAELADAGAGRDAPVGIALPAGLQFAQALHACLLLGAPAVPIDLRLAERERAAVAARCAVVLDTPLSAPRGSEGRPAPARPDERHDLDAVAAVIHTSGTSGDPRPVGLTYGNLLWSALGSAVALGVADDERWLCVLPLSHVGGLSILLRSAVYATTAVVHERFETDRVAAALAAGEVTLISVVATTLERLLDAGVARPPALRAALTGGGPVPAALRKRAAEAGVGVSLTYGLTEAASQVTTTPAAELDAAEDDGAAATPAGPPLFCTEVALAPDGEILVRGPTVAPGAFAPDGWLHTGDLGSLDERGRLAVSGRKADTIVSGGENVSPVEIEGVLEAHPSVREAAVVGRSDPQWGEAVTAIVVAAGDTATLDEGRLRDHCARVLAPYKVPKRFELRSEPLPRTRSGKLLRREL